MERRTELVEAIEKTTKEVKKQNQIETAKKLLKNNVDIAIIADSTGLSKEEIENLL